MDNPFNGLGKMADMLGVSNWALAGFCMLMLLCVVVTVFSKGNNKGTVKREKDCSKCSYKLKVSEVDKPANIALKSALEEMNFLKKYDSGNAEKNIRVYIKNGKSYVGYSSYIDINVDLENGVDRGFFRMGNAYEFINRNNNNNSVGLVYVTDNGKEMPISLSNIPKDIKFKEVIWSI